MKRSHKYKAKSVTTDEGYFASTAEYLRWGELVTLAKYGAISDLRRQVEFVLHAPGGEVVGKYVGDATYRENGELVVEDVKGFATELYRWKKRHLKAEYGIEIREIKPRRGRKR